MARTVDDLAQGLFEVAILLEPERAALLNEAAGRLYDLERYLREAESGQPIIRLALPDDPPAQKSHRE